jgi:hypothetical protein
VRDVDMVTSDGDGDGDGDSEDDEDDDDNLCVFPVAQGTQTRGNSCGPLKIT